MSKGGGGHYYWYLRHNPVETDADVCPAASTMGPQNSRISQQEPARVVERNEQWDAEDAVDRR